MFFATFRQQKHNVEVLAVRVSANLSGSVETFQSDALLMVRLGKGTNTSWLGLEKLGNHADSSTEMCSEYPVIFALPNVETQS